MANKEDSKKKQKQVNPKKIPNKNGVKSKMPKDGYGMLSAMLISTTGALVLSILLLVSTLASSEKIYFFKADEEKVSRIINLSKPNHKTSIVSNWVSDAMVSIFNFNYVNIESHLNKESQKWFTDGGRDALIQSLKRSNYFKEIVNKKVIVELTVLQTPVFVDKRINSAKRLEWLFQMPVLITYIKSEAEPEVSEALITLAVERVPFEENKKGLGISKMVISR